MKRKYDCLLKNLINYKHFELPEQLPLAYYDPKSDLCEKHACMENCTDNAELFQQYETFANMILEDRTYRDESMTFRTACSRAGVDPEALDGVIRKELGVSGDGLLRILREKEKEIEAGKSDPPAKK